MIPRMWSADVFEHKGRFFHVPPTQVIPKPVQAPHPPMFAACTKPESAVAVGKLGLGALNFAFGNDEYLTQKVHEYRAAVATAKPIGRQKNEWFACTPATLVLEDDREAARFGLRGARFFAETLTRYYLSGTRPTGRLDVARDFMSEGDLRDAMEQRNAPGTQVAAIVGDPACAKETVARFADIGVDELILVMQLGTVPHELIMKSLRTFAEKVIPDFS
jgi:alkanesulfonate monooxygenase SsuD/methylene tetrahydromethanopterin reductase-like flavin-dependent oxidoreductase (luciferase family)